MAFIVPESNRFSVRIPKDMIIDIQDVAEFLEGSSIETDNSKLLRMLIKKGLEKLELEGILIRNGEVK